MTPAGRGAVDELLEPVWSRPKRTMLLPSQRRNARQPILPTSDRRTVVRNTTTNHPRIPTTTRARIRPHRTHDQHQHLDTAPLLQECRSALRVKAPNARTERRPQEPLARHIGTYVFVT